MNRNLILNSLSDLISTCGIAGIKSEFEAEGASINDVFRLRAITERYGVALSLKIGGPEALRDIRDSLEIGVDRVIAPMIESTFGVAKFLAAVYRVYRGINIETAINIETKTSLTDLASILMYGKDNGLHGVTIGRHDLRMSYLSEKISEVELDDVILFIAESAKKHDLEVTIGGEIDKAFLKTFESKRYYPLVDHVETRLVIFEKNSITKCYALEKALLLESAILQQNINIRDLWSKFDTERVDILSSRTINLPV